MSLVVDILTLTCVIGGALFMLVAALGVLRFPDLIMRMHAATKAGTLGAGLLLLAAALYYGETGLTTRAIATIIFLLLTAPVSAHAIGRAGYFSGVHLNTHADELRPRYDEKARRREAAARARAGEGPR
jgi:multicomponent Na+:H+ antiporter subunit G